MIKFKDFRYKVSKLFTEDQQMKIVIQISKIFWYFRKYFLGVEINYDKKFLNNWEQIKHFSCCDKERNFNLYQYINIHNQYFRNKATNVIEFGVSKGASIITIAKFIKENTNIYALDSFGEFAKDIKKLSVSSQDTYYQNTEHISFSDENRFKNFNLQNLKYKIETLKNFKQKNKKLHMIKCFFQANLNQSVRKKIDGKVYSFCHIDFDLRLPTLEALKFIFPKLKKNGILIIDDYNFINQDGVKAAVKEFGLDLKACFQTQNGQLIYFKK